MANNSIPFVSPIDMNWNQLLNVRLQILNSNPSNNLEGLYYYNSTTHKVMYYNGTEWKPMGDEYSLPVATAVILGGVKSGGDVTIDENGIISVNDNSHNHLSANISDLESVVKAYKLNEFAIPNDSLNINNQKITNLSQGTNPTDAVNKEQLDNALSGIAGGLIYKGVIPTNDVPDDAKKGWFYKIGSDGNYYGIECNVGDMLIVNKDLSTTPTADDFDKIDNTESKDIVRLDTEQTLTNKTIDAEKNTITNLKAENFANNVLLQKYIESNPSLDSVGGTCTWTINHNKQSEDLIFIIKRLSDKAIVMASCNIIDENNIAVLISSDITIPEKTYKITII